MLTTDHRRLTTDERNILYQCHLRYTTRRVNPCPFHELGVPAIRCIVPHREVVYRCTLIVVQRCLHNEESGVAYRAAGL